MGFVRRRRTKPARGRLHPSRKSGFSTFSTVSGDLDADAVNLHALVGPDENVPGAPRSCGSPPGRCAPGLTWMVTSGVRTSSCLGSTRLRGLRPASGPKAWSYWASKASHMGAATPQEDRTDRTSPWRAGGAAPPCWPCALQSCPVAGCGRPGPRDSCNPSASVSPRRDSKVSFWTAAGMGGGVRNRASMSSGWFSPMSRE